MTPAARVAAAIEVLDAVLAGDSAERALSQWGRAHRFAGSKDRAAIRDHVFQAIRCRASYAWQGGAETGRGLMLGALRETGGVDDVFTGDGYAPAPVEATEAGQPLADAPRAIRLDMPDWMLPLWDNAFADETDTVLAAMRDRAGVFLRVNQSKANVSDATKELKADGIKVRPVSGVKNALQVIENERRVSSSKAYTSGLVELQDPSSQTAIEALGLTDAERVLDYCAGGGGKALAMAATGAQVTAHDIDPKRMKDIKPRAARAGVQIELCDLAGLKRTPAFDLVFCDAPCSGSGTWRRTPEAKWNLTAERLEELTRMQMDVLRSGSGFVEKGGRLVYATCSIFEAENKAIVSNFLSDREDFTVLEQSLMAPSETCDGFFFTVLKRLDI